jgi:hypothetical protein
LLKENVNSKIISLVTRALTHEEPQLHVQPGAAQGVISTKGSKRRGKVSLTHCGDGGGVVVLERPMCI